jgi:hypothetical protein
MILPSNFLFSQSNLQDFSDCRRRFQLRHLQQVAWPAVLSEPVLAIEHRMQQGANFHKLVQMHHLGIPLPQIEALLLDPLLRQWWQAYLESAPDLRRQAGFPPDLTPHAASVETCTGQVSVEAVLVAGISGFRLAARYDRLEIVGSRALIIDWKTSQHRPRRDSLARRLQTRIYPYLLCHPACRLNAGQPFHPQQVVMLYWFAEFPHQPEVFAYSLEQFQADGEFLARLVGLIVELDEQGFFQTDVLSRCEVCVYRSLCGRGVAAGAWSTLQVSTAGEASFLDEEAADLDLDRLQLSLEQVGEIEF